MTGRMQMVAQRAKHRGSKCPRLRLEGGNVRWRWPVKRYTWVRALSVWTNVERGMHVYMVEE